MTLIAEIFDPRTVSVYISDCLVTNTQDIEERLSNFPIHFGSGREIKTRGSALASKILTGDGGFIIGSGYENDIINIAADFLRLGKTDLSGFQSFLDAYYSERPKDEAFIYGSFGNEKPMSSDSYCIRFEAGHLHISCGGSGGKYFKDLFENRTPDPKQGVFSLAAQALGIVLESEFSDGNFADHYFGGAYEVAVFDEGKFVKVPYNIIDCTGVPFLAADGVYDVFDVRAKRIVSSIPFAAGVNFVVSELRHGFASCTTFLAPEIHRVAEEFEVQRHRSLHDILSDFKPMFDLVLLRHHGVGSEVGRGIVTCQNGRIGVNQEKLIETINRMQMPRYQP